VAAAGALLTWLVYGAACSVEPLDLTGKRCPCAAGFVCDTAKGTCVIDDGDAGVVVVDAAGGVDAADVTAPDAAGRIVVYGLRPTWQTGNGIRWDWQVLGDGAQFDRYEVVTGPSAEDVRARSAATKVFDATMNPELGAFAGRVATPPPPPFSLWTVTDGHNHGQTVFAQVIAYDKAGGVTVTEIPSAITTRPRRALVLYDDGIPDGGTLAPAGTKTSTDAPFEGTQCLEHTIDCKGAPSCDVTVGVTGMVGKLANAIDLTDFDRAYVELAVRGPRLPGTFSDLVLALNGEGCGAPCRMRFSGLPSGPQPTEWRLVQIPLRVLKRNDGAGANLNYAELSNRNFRVQAFLVQGTWPDGSALALDQSRIRW
jgi:hypothetical protein